MSLGKSYNNNKSNDNYNVQVYSKYGFGNPLSKIDPTALSFRFWKGSLVISILPRIATNDDSIDYDKQNAISIYLSHTKARLLAYDILEFLNNPGTISSAGVVSGAGLITITDGSEFNSSNPCLVIRKKGEDGGIQSSYAYEFKSDYHFTVRNYNEKNDTFDQHLYPQLEIDEFVTLLEEYYKSMTNALAYSFMEVNKYHQSKVEQALGIGAGNKSSNSFFNGKNTNNNSNKGSTNNNSFSNSSIEDIENMING